MEQVLDVPVPEMVEVPKTVSQDKIQQRIVEQIIDVPVSQVVKELVEVSKVFPQDSTVLRSRPLKLLLFYSR